MNELADYDNDDNYSIDHTEGNYESGANVVSSNINRDIDSSNIYSISRSSDNNNYNKNDNNNSNNNGTGNSISRECIVDTNINVNELHHSPSNHNPLEQKYDTPNNNQAEVEEQGNYKRRITESGNGNAMHEEEINFNENDELYKQRQQNLFFILTFFCQLREHLLQYELEQLEFYLKLVVVLLLCDEKYEQKCLIERNVRIAAAEALTIMLELAYNHFNISACQEWQKVLLTPEKNIIHNAEVRINGATVGDAYNDIHCALLAFNALLTASMKKKPGILEVNWSNYDRKQINYVQEYINKNLENQSLGTDVRNEIFTSLPLLAACNNEFFIKYTVPELPRLFRVVFTCANEVDERSELFRILPLLFKSAPTLLTHKYKIILKHVSVLTPCIRLIMSYIDQTLYVQNTQVNKNTIKFTANHTVFLSALACFTRLADDFREQIRPYVQLLLEPMIRSVITQESTRYLVVICKTFPELRSKCLTSVLNQIRECLMSIQYVKQIRNMRKEEYERQEELRKDKEVVTNYSERQESEYEEISPKCQQQFELQEEQEEEEKCECECEQEQIVNKMQILWSFDFANYSSLPFLCEVILPYTTHRCEEIRQYAVALCIKLMFSGCAVPLGANMHSEHQCSEVNRRVVHSGGEHIQLINTVVTRLVESSVADYSRRIRVYIIEQFNSSFDVFLASTRNIHRLQLALFNSYKEKLLMIKLLGRLTVYNPSSLLPIFNTILTQVLASMQDTRELNVHTLEENWWALNSLLDAAPTTVKPYHRTLLTRCSKFMQQFNSHTSLLAALLSCTGKLTQLASLTDCGKLICSLQPQIVEWIVHSESLLIKQEAIRALTHVIRFTKRLDVYETNPCLFNVLTSLLRTQHDKTFKMQTDILRLIGCIGAIAPAKMKEIANGNKPCSTNEFSVKTSESSRSELQKEFELSQQKVLITLGLNYTEKDLCEYTISEILLVLTDVTLNNNKIYLKAIDTMRRIMERGDCDDQLIADLSEKIVDALLYLAQHRKEISYFAIMEIGYYVDKFYWQLELHVKSIINTLIEFISTENKADCLVAVWHVLAQLRYKLCGYFKQYVLASVQSTMNVTEKLQMDVLEYSLIFIIALKSLLKDILYLVIPWIINVLNDIIDHNYINEGNNSSNNNNSNSSSKGNRASKHTLSCCNLAIDAITCTAIAEPDFVYYAPRCLWCLDKLLTALRQRHSTLLHHNTVFANEQYETELKEINELNTSVMSTYKFIVDLYNKRGFPPVLLSFHSSPLSSSSSSVMFTKNEHIIAEENSKERMENLEEEKGNTSIDNNSSSNNRSNYKNYSSDNYNNHSSATSTTIRRNVKNKYNSCKILQMLEYTEKNEELSLLSSANRVIGDISNDTRTEYQNDVHKHQIDNSVFNDAIEYGSNNINNSNNNNINNNNISRSWSSVINNLLLLLNDAASWTMRMSHSRARKWLWKLYLSIIHSNPFTLIQQTYELARMHEMFARRLFNVAFAVLHRELINRGEERYVQKVNIILTNSHVSVIILQALLNLAEFMERIRTGYTLTTEPSNLKYNYPFDINSLITASKRCRWYFKTIHYVELKLWTEKYRLERQHLVRDSTGIAEIEHKLVNLRNKCIELYNFLGYSESAEGMQTYLEQNFRKLVNDVNAEMTEIKNSSLISKLRCWSQSVSTDFEKLEKHYSGSTQSKVQRLRELDNMGKYNELLKEWKFLLARTEQRDVKEFAPYGAYAAWLLRSWDDLQVASTLMPDEEYFNVTATFYKATLSARSKEDSNISQCLINECRCGLYSSISTILTESYDRTYALFVGLQQLSELEEYNLATRDVYSRAHWKELWERRLTSMKYDGWPGTLANHTLLLTPVEELSVWLQFVCLSRVHNKPAISKMVLSDLLHNKSIEEAITSTNTLKEEKTLSISPLPQIALAALEHEYGTGNKLYAIDLLKKYISVIRTVCDTLLKENNNNIVEKSKKLESASVTALACCYAQLAWWMCLYGESIVEYDSIYNNNNNNNNNNINNKFNCNLVADTVSSLQHINGKNVNLCEKTKNERTNINKRIRPSEKIKMWESKEFAKEIMEFSEYATNLDPVNGSIWHTVAETSNKLVSILTTRLSKKIKPEVENMITERLVAEEQKRVMECEEQPRSDECIRPYVLQAVSSYLKSIEYNEKLEDVLSFLELWFDHTFLHEMSDSCQKLKEKIVRIKPAIWCKAIPQLVARVCGQEVTVCESVKNLLMHIAKTHPQALLYNLSIYENNNMYNDLDAITSSDNANTCNIREKAAKDILTAISTCNESNSILIHETRFVSREFVRCSMLWYEIWLDKISSWMEEFRNTKNMEIFAHRLKLLPNIFTDPETQEEKREKLEWGDSLFSLCNMIAFAVEKNSEQTTLQEYEKELERHLASIDLLITKMSFLELKKVSPKLQECGNNLSIVVPGQYNTSNVFPRINKINEYITLINSKQHPRKVEIIGDDGEKYLFLLKGHEDLRLDERVMQLLNLVNIMLSERSIVRRLESVIQTYSVTPLNSSAGLIGWVHYCNTLHNLILAHREDNKDDLQREELAMWTYCKSEDKLSRIHCTEAFEWAVNSTPGDDLAKSMWLSSTNTNMWLERRTTYTCSLATMSMVGYILGLGDRHLQNIMLHNTTGRIVHIDYGDCFDVARTRKYYPEYVPFRLTRMLRNAMEVCDYEGLFKHNCISVMNMLQEESSKILIVLQTFVHDPLVGWEVNKTRLSKEYKEEFAQRENEALSEEFERQEESATADAIIRMIKGKLKGAVYKNELISQSIEYQKNFFVEDQVKMLIKEATDFENLSIQYSGLKSYW